MRRRTAAMLVAAAVAMAGAAAWAAAAEPTPTPTPPPNPCAFLPCTGTCALPAPCTPGAPCPQYVIEGRCAVVNDVCTCVTDDLTPAPTPTFGGCGLTCDSSPCTGRCADGTLAPGSCTVLTVDQGCACAPQCETPSPTPVPTEPCAGEPCGGPCGVCPPCAPAGCEAACQLGTCQLVSGACTCVLATPPPVSTPTPTPALAPCVGDCNADGQVTVNEIITGVNIALGNALVSACPAMQCNLPNVLVDVTCIEQAVHDALFGCLSWYQGCGPPVVGFDPCPSTVTFCTTEQVGAPCTNAGATCCRAGSLCTAGWCNTPLVCTNMRPRFCPV
jgi:hypothetical protein